MKKTVKLIVLVCMILLSVTIVAGAYTNASAGAGSPSSPGGGGGSSFVPNRCYHDFCEWNVVRYPGCYYYGLEELICNICFEVVDSRDIPPTEEHIYDFDIIPPTCTEQGFTYYYCTEPYCGAYYYDDYTDIIEHSMSDWEVWFEPYCESEGYKIRWCMGCGMSEEADIPPLGHDRENGWWNTEFPGCTYPGSENLMCGRCGHYLESYEIPASGHEYFVVEQVLPTCTQQGYTYFSCWRCSDSYIGDIAEPLGPLYGDYWETITDATCQQLGLKRRYCEFYYMGYCNHYLEETIEKTDHWWRNWSTVTQPDCLNSGTKVRSCVYCDKEETDTVPASGHSFGEWTPYGYDESGEVATEMRICSTCMAEEYRSAKKKFTSISTNKVGNRINASIVSNKMLDGTKVWFVAYGDDSRFLGIRFAKVKDSCASAEFSEENIANIKALAWGDGMTPACNFVSTNVTQ